MIRDYELWLFIINNNNNNDAEYENKNFGIVCWTKQMITNKYSMNEWKIKHNKKFDFKPKTFSLIFFEQIFSSKNFLWQQKNWGKNIFFLKNSKEGKVERLKTKSDFFIWSSRYKQA